MSFVYPWVLFFLAAVPVLALLSFWLISSGRRRLFTFISPALYSRFCGGKSSALLAVQASLAIAGLALVIFAAARPQWGRNDVKAVSRGRNLIIALDVSRSMLAADVHPNRLERAKADITDLVNELEGDRAGILAFRGKAVMLCPPTSDYAFLRQTIDGISVDSAPRGETDIADAILKCLSAFSGTEGENNAVILISDGEDLAGRAEKLAAKAGEKRIPVFTVGIGDPAGSDIPGEDGKGPLKYRGETVKSKLTENTLEAIARASGGVYIPLATSGTARTTLGAIYRRHLAKIAEHEMEEMLGNRLVERFQLFLIPGVLLLICAAMLSRGRLASATRRGGRSAHHSSAATALVCAVLSLLAADMRGGDAEGGEGKQVTGAAAARDAQSLYRDGDYSAAAAKYLDAATGMEDPERAAQYRYNSGAASYAAGDMEKASSALFPVIARPGFARAAELYGAAQFKLASSEKALTNNQLKAEYLSKAATGFQNALREKPEDERAVRNLARAVNGLPALRSAAHVDSVLAKYAKTVPDELIAKMLGEERSIIEACSALSTNSSASALISGLEKLAKRQSDAADIWIPLKGQMLESQAFTNEEARAAAEAHFNEAHETMKRGASLLEDIDSDALNTIAEGENYAYGLWKAAADPRGLLEEAMQTQANVIANPQRNRFPARGDWPESLSLTEEFMKKFPEWAQRKIEESQSDTNRPPFTVEMAREIMKHSESIRIIQQDAVDNTDAAQQKSAAEEVVKLQEKIRELMPKEKDDKKDQDQKKQDQKKQDQQQDQQDQGQQNQQESDAEDQEEEGEEKEQEKEVQPSGESEEAAKDIKELLRRALERENEHDRQKQNQRRKIKLPPDARDW